MLWWARQDSNLRPRDYESPALPLRHKPISCDILFNCQIALDRATFLSKNDTQSFFSAECHKPIGFCLHLK